MVAQLIQPVQARRAVMHGMYAPQDPAAVLCQVQKVRGKLDAEQRQSKLQRQRPAHRPNRELGCPSATSPRHDGRGKHSSSAGQAVGKERVQAVGEQIAPCTCQQRCSGRSRSMTTQQAAVRSSADKTISDEETPAQPPAKPRRRPRLTRRSRSRAATNQPALDSQRHREQKRTTRGPASTLVRSRLGARKNRKGARLRQALEAVARREAGPEFRRGAGAGWPRYRRAAAGHKPAAEAAGRRAAWTTPAGGGWT